MTFADRVVVMNGGRIAMGEARTKSEAKCNSDGAQGRDALVEEDQSVRVSNQRPRQL